MTFSNAFAPTKVGLKKLFFFFCCCCCYYYFLFLRTISKINPKYSKLTQSHPPPQDPYWHQPKMQVVNVLESKKTSAVASGCWNSKFECAIQTRPYVKVRGTITNPLPFFLIPPLSLFFPLFFCFFFRFFFLFVFCSIFFLSRPRPQMSSAPTPSVRLVDGSASTPASN